MKYICDWHNCKEIGEYKAPVEKDNSKKFRMLFIYKGKYVSLPKYPNFIEGMETPAEKTNIYISDYNKKKLD